MGMILDLGIWVFWVDYYACGMWVRMLIFWELLHYFLFYISYIHIKLMEIQL